MLALVRPAPTGGDLLDLFNVIGQIAGKSSVTHNPVVAFDVGVLLRIAWLDVEQRDILPLGPCL